MAPYNSLPRAGDRGNRHRWDYASRLYNRSLNFLEGMSAAEDPRQAFQLNAQAAAYGMHDAVLAMGWFYLNGVGVEVDRDEARRWYRKSARQGATMAMYSLGSMAYEERDYANAAVWLRRAADQGHSNSLFWLGKMYWRGHGVPTRKRLALALFQKAAAARVPAAQRVLKFLSRNPLRARRITPPG